MAATVRDCGGRVTSTSADTGDLMLLRVDGVPIARAGAGNVLEMPWGAPLKGMYPVLRPEPGGDGPLCDSGSAVEWTGRVVLAAAFYGPGCSYEARARLAAARGARGLLFDGAYHSPFDWDGSSQRMLPDAAVVLHDVYACLDDAVRTALHGVGGDTAVAAAANVTLEVNLTSTRTPLAETWYTAYGGGLDALLLLLVLSNVLIGARQQYNFHRVRMEPSTRTVVALEMVSQVRAVPPRRHLKRAAPALARPTPPTRPRVVEWRCCPRPWRMHVRGSRARAAALRRASGDDLRAIAQWSWVGCRLAFGHPPLDLSAHSIPLHRHPHARDARGRAPAAEDDCADPHPARPGEIAHLPQREEWRHSQGGLSQ